MIDLGERFSVCECCKKKFEQEFDVNRNRYENFKLCPKCRDVSVRGKNKMQVSRSSYTPFEWQKKADELLENHNYLVLACGARTGKDRFSNMQIVKYIAELYNEHREETKPDAIPSFLIWSVAPTLNMARQNFRELKKSIPKEWVEKILEDDMRFELKGNGELEIKSAYDVESLVGVGLDFCAITEAARIRDLRTVWRNIEMRLLSPGRGRAKDRKGNNAGCGKCIINSSPVGKTFFYDLYKRGDPNDIANYNPLYASLNLPCTENPYMAEALAEEIETRYGTTTRIELMRKEMLPNDFARDVLGQFADDNGSVFGEFRAKCVEDLYSKTIRKSQSERERFAKDWREPIPGNQYRIGYDPATGSSNDDPAIVVRDMTTNHIVFVQSLYGKTYDRQWDEISYISTRYNYAPCCWLRTGHTPVENQLAKRGVVEIPIAEQGGKKAELVQSLARAIQNEDLKVLDDGSEANKKLIKQMIDYTEKDGKYGNLDESNDDFVSALYAVYYDYSVESAAADDIFLGFIGGV